MNGGPLFQINQAISFVVPCDTQQEIDFYWDKLRAGGDPEAQQCGWLKDQFGVSWQVVPKFLAELFKHPDSEADARVMNALLQMRKLDLAALQRAAGKGK
jgi:predicted 3-demethylubiquinone-9 3-methyltransferase (glyoxalase superfamily)